MIVWNLPSHAKGVHRSGSNVGGNNLYVVPAGKTLYITSCYVFVTGDGVNACNVSLSCDEEQSATTRDLIRIGVAAGASTPIHERSTSVYQRVVGGGAVDFVLNTGTAGAFSAGFTGFLD